MNLEQLQKLNLEEVDYEKYYKIVIHTLREHAILLQTALDRSYESFKISHPEVELPEDSYKTMQEGILIQFNDTMSALLVTCKINHDKFHVSEKGRTSHEP